MFQIFLLFLISLAVSSAIQWKGIASTQNGDHLVAIADGKGIYSSKDHGLNWIPSSAPPLTWNKVSISKDGKFVAATALQDGVYISNNEGLDWKKANLEDSDEWYSVKMSADGKYLFAGTSSGIYRSVDFGETWEKTLNVIGNWHALSMDSTGKRGIVVGMEGGIFLTSDYGFSWSPSQSQFSGEWVDVSCDNAGAKCALVGTNERIYISKDYGVEWEPAVSEQKAWKSITSDASGNYFAAAADQDKIFVSADAGSSWQPTESPVSEWTSVIMGPNELSILALTAQNENIYETTTFGKQWETLTNKIEKQYESLFTLDTKDLFSSVSLFSVTNVPSSRPTGKPTAHPTSRPTAKPTARPTSRPTAKPTSVPSSRPTAKPTSAPTSRPTAVPTGQPSSQPSLQPTSSPTAPTFAPYQTGQPTPTPTFAPTIQVVETVAVEAAFTFKSVRANFLNPTSQETIIQSVAEIANTTTQNVDLISFKVISTETGRRLLTEKIIDILATTFTFEVVARIRYNMVNFPGLSPTQVANLKAEDIKTAVVVKTFQAVLNDLAVANNATQLLGVTVPNVTVVTAIIPPPIFDTNSENISLSDGQIAGIVIGVILGSFIVFLLFWWLIRDRRSNMAVRYEGTYKPEGPAVLVEDHPSKLNDNNAFDQRTVTIHVGHQQTDADLEAQQLGMSTDITDGYLQIRL